MQLVDSVAAPATSQHVNRISKAAATKARAAMWRQDPRRFGRFRPPDITTATVDTASRPQASRVASELGLFAVTFLAGFLFVSILLA
jgi:hypothetical protein